MATHAGLIVVAAALAGSLWAAGCHRKVAPPDPCVAIKSALVEVRDREGVLELALRPAGGGAAIVCDAHGRALGTLARAAEPPALILKNAAGDADATLTFARRPGDSAELEYQHLKLRLYDEGGLLRLLDSQGVPIGQVARHGDHAIVFDPAGRPLVEARRADPTGDRRMLRGTDDMVKRLVTGTHDDRAAAAFAVETLPLAERLLVSRWLDQ